jgi:DNA-binding transcriptional ArsR family regulator
VEHPVRLDILMRLDRQPLTLSRLSASIDKNEVRVVYHLRVLRSSGLVDETGDEEERQPLYVARLSDQACWVARAVNERAFRNPRHPRHSNLGLSD